jgi:hypothetical protein
MPRLVGTARRVLTIPTFMAVIFAEHAAMDDARRRAIALFRFGVLGPLVSARLEHGDRAALFAMAAQRDYVTPDGRVVRISARTIETWYYAHRAGGLAALMPEPRGDVSAIEN